ncbi:hypothetical protein ACI2VH_21025 [Ralstonia nicotianae]
MTTTNTRTGSSTHNRAAILNSPIPAGHFGRSLTSAECRTLRTLGWSVSERCIVIRSVSDWNYYGSVLRPTGSRDNVVYSPIGIHVETK